MNGDPPISGKRMARETVVEASRKWVGEVFQDGLFTAKSLHISGVAAVNYGAGLMATGVILSTFGVANAGEVLIGGLGATSYGLPVSLALVANNYRQAIRNIAPYNAVINHAENQYAQEVDLGDLTQKYQNFYDGFSAYCERKHGTDGREFAQEYLLPKLSNFVATGQEFNFDDDVDVEAAINPEPTQTATEISILEQKTDDTPNRSVATQMESVFRITNRDQSNTLDEESSRSSSNRY